MVAVLSIKILKQSPAFGNMCSEAGQLIDAFFLIGHVTLA
jgi:hypothetical protein